MNRNRGNRSKNSSQSQKPKSNAKAPAKTNKTTKSPSKANNTVKSPIKTGTVSMMIKIKNDAILESTGDLANNNTQTTNTSPEKPKPFVENEKLTWANRKQYSPKRTGKNRKGSYSTFSSSHSINNAEDNGRKSPEHQKSTFDFNTTRKLYLPDSDSPFISDSSQTHIKIKQKKNEPSYNGLFLSSKLFETHKNYLICSQGSLIYVWDTSMEECSLIFAGHTSTVQNLSLGCSHICVSSSEAETLIWNFKSGRIERNLSGERLVSMHPNQMRVLVSNKLSIDIYDIVKNRIIKSIITRNINIKTINWVHKSNKAISSSEDGIIRIWSSDTGNLEKTLKGHSTQIKNIYISPEGNECFSLSIDGIVKVWDILKGICIYSFNISNPFDSNSVFVYNHNNGKKVLETNEMDKIKQILDIILDEKDVQCIMKVDDKFVMKENYPEDFSSFCFLNS